jgi:hypothetical protein
VTQLRVGQIGIEATGKAANVVAQNLVGAIHHYSDGGQNKCVLRYRLRAVKADKPLPYFHECLRKQIHSPSLSGSQFGSCLIALLDPVFQHHSCHISF